MPIIWKLNGTGRKDGADMVSDKLDRVIAAESAAADRIKAAEAEAAEIIREAKADAERIKKEKSASAASRAKTMLSQTEEECMGIGAKYAEEAEAEADRISRDAAKNEMYGMSAVIIKMIP